MRIDAHHHLWTLARGDYGWLKPELAPIYRDFELSDLAPHLSAAGIAGTKRAEQLSVADFARLANALADRQPQHR